MYDLAKSTVLISKSIQANFKITYRSGGHIGIPKKFCYPSHYDDVCWVSRVPVVCSSQWKVNHCTHKIFHHPRLHFIELSVVYYSKFCRLSFSSHSANFSIYRFNLEQLSCDALSALIHRVLSVALIH